MIIGLRHGIALALSAGAALVACDGHPGGTVGDPCSDVGSGSECRSNEICDSIDDGSSYCLQLCSDHDDCASGERCNGVSGNDVKACHPEGDEDFDDFDDGANDCPFDDPGCKKGKG